MKNTVIMLLLILATQLSNAQQSSSEFIHIGDPQYGYSLDYKRGVAERMDELITVINGIKPEFVIIPGDLVEDRTITERWAIEKDLNQFTVPLVIIPGNHDIIDARSLKWYRKYFGADYGRYEFSNSVVLATNSEIMRDTTISESEYNKQWQWFEQQIKAHINGANGKKRLIITTHRPPFRHKLLEEEKASNWPPITRKRFLDLAEQAGASMIIAGHSHTTSIISDSQYSFNIYTVGGTSRVFDDNGSGYRLFTLQDNSYQQKYIQTSSPPKVAKGFLGFKGWTPRLFDLSIRHWLFTFFYFALFLLLFSQAQSIKQKNWQRTLLATSFWVLFFAINMQLDFDELITETGRSLFDGQPKQTQQLIGFAFVGILALILTGLSVWIVKGKQWLSCIAYLALTLPMLAWFCLQMMSHHDIRILWPESWWDTSFVVTAILMAFIAFIKGTSD